MLTYYYIYTYVYVIIHTYTFISLLYPSPVNLSFFFLFWPGDIGEGAITVRCFYFPDRESIVIVKINRF